MSAFDPKTFEETVIDKENQTSYIPVPENDYEAFIEDFAFKNPKGNAILDVNWVIPDEKLEKDLGMEQVAVRQSIFLDLTEDGQLDFGPNKNVRLGRLREALGLNKGQFQWSMLRGKKAKISVSQRADDNDPTIIYNDVKKVAKAA